MRGKSKKDHYTEDERNELYDLVDDLASTYFSRGDDAEWEKAVLRMAEIVKAKQGRTETDIAG